MVARILAELVLHVGRCSLGDCAELSTTGQAFPGAALLVDILVGSVVLLVLKWNNSSRSSLSGHRVLMPHTDGKIPAGVP